MNEPWECPRCGRINAPFTPACFCSREKNCLQKIVEGEKRKAEIVIGLMSKFYNPRCSACNGSHAHGQQCMNLTMS